MWTARKYCGPYVLTDGDQLVLSLTVETRLLLQNKSRMRYVGYGMPSIRSEIALTGG